MPGTILSVRDTAVKEGKRKSKENYASCVYILVEADYEQNKNKTKK